MSHLEALEADTVAGAEIRSRLGELAALKAGRERELEATEHALARKPDREQAQELVDLLPQLDVDVSLLAEHSFRELLAALDFRATFEPARNELRMRATLAPEFLPVKGDDMSSPLSVPPAGTGRKGRRPSSAFVRVEANYRIFEVRVGPDLPIVDAEITVGTRRHHQSTGG